MDEGKGANRQKEYPEGSGNWYPTFDAEYKLELTLVEKDRCSGIRNDFKRCAISTTLKTKLGAVAVETGKTVMYVLWYPTHGPNRGTLVWERWEIPPSTRLGIDRFDGEGHPIPAEVYFLPMRASDKLLRNRRDKNKESWPSRQPEYRKVQRQRAKRGGLVVSRSMAGHVKIEKDD